MALDKGRNAGITGLCDWPGAGVKFVANLSGWALSGDVSERSRNGRGTGRWARARRVLSSGNLALKGTVRSDGYPLPATFEGVEGSVTIKLSGAQSAAVPVRVLTFKCSLSDTQQGLWDVSLTARVTAMPTFTGFGGSQPTYTLPDIGAQELYEGLTKSLDPSDLLSTATQTIDVWGLGDTNAAERQELADLIAAAVAPMAGLKVRSAALNPGRDADAGVVTITWGRTTTAEDQTLPATVQSVDPAGIGSTGTAAAINGDPTPPAGDSFVLRGTATRSLNDGNVLTIGTYGLTTTQQDIEFPETFNTLDPSDLESTGQEVVVYDPLVPAPDPTIPDGLQLVSTSVVTINPQRFKVEYHFAKDTSQQKAEQEGTFTLADPQALETTAQVALLDATPSVPSGLYLRATRTQQLTHDHALNTIICGVRSTKDDREMPGTFYDVDPNAIDTAGRDTRVYLTAGSAPAVTPLHGCKIVSTKTELVDHVHSQQTVTLGIADSVDKILNPKNTSLADPANLKSTKDIALWSTDPAPSTPSGYKLVATLDALIPEGRTVRVYRYGLASSADEEAFGHTKALTDVEDLEGEATTGVVFTTGSPPSTPSTPAGLKLASYFDVPLTAAGTSNQSVRVFRWAKRTSKDEVELGTMMRPHTIAHVDPDGLDDWAHVGKVDATPTVPAGLVLRGTDVIPLNQGTGSDHVLNKIEAGRRSTKDDVEMPGTFAETDPAGLRSRARDTEVYVTAGGEPADPATPIAGLEIVARRTDPLDRINSKRVLEFAPLTSAEEEEHRETVASDDPIKGGETAVGTITTVAATATAAVLGAAALAANQGTLAFGGATVRKLNKTKALTTIRTVNDHLTVTGHLRTRREKVLGIPAVSLPAWSSTSVNAQVRVARIPTLGANNTTALLQHVEVDRTRGILSVRRRVVIPVQTTLPLSEADLAAAFHTSDIGKLNNAAMLGCAAHVLKYSGFAIAHDYGLMRSAHVLLMDYEYEYDSYEHMNLSKLAFGWVPTASSTTYISVTGDVTATTYFSADMKIFYPAETDLSWVLA